MNGGTISYTDIHCTCILLQTNALESRTYVIDQRGPQVVPNIEIVHIASDLEPNTDYSVHLVAWNKYGSAESEVMHVSTSSGMSTATSRIYR